jgi:hypothetical protein
LVPSLDCAPAGADFERLGFDAVSKSSADSFECSPLSCNAAARELPTNAFALLDSLEAAIAAARKFSSGNWEPGVYYVAEVHRRRRTGR